MLNITLKDGSIKEYDENISCYDLCVQISQGLARAALAAKLDGKIVDLTTPITKDCTFEALTFDSPEGKHVFWHTSSHILAQAVMRLYPKTKLAIGPAIENGFYYDFDTESPLGVDDLAKIEAEMQKIVKENIKLRRFTLEKDEAIKFAEEKNQPYKAILINELKDGEVISFYEQGEFTDLCAGAHLYATGAVKAIKLTNVTGAYWKGDAKNKMVTRVYGISFAKSSELQEYLDKVEEAKKRDHNKIGRELEYFTAVETIGQGLPVLLPKGARVIQLLQRFVEDEEQKRGYILTKTPLMGKSDIYKISGHWDHYKEGMFVIGDEENDDDVYALRPMTCPFQYQVFLNRMRSYRDLPMRLGETSTLFRNESSGEMHGLIRVRQFTISEGHLICTADQLEDEFKGCVELAMDMLKIIGLDEDVSFRFSKWDPENTEKYIGTVEQWDEAQNMMARILDNIGMEYSIGIGEAAFYGPKLDIQIKNVHGKEDTIITIQIDQMLSEKFGMEFVDADGSRKHPYIIHRTSIGCYERTLALLLEKYAGAMPLWLAPVQVKVLPISEKYLDYAISVEKMLKEAGLRTELDDRSEKIGFKIREAQIEKVPYMLILGEKEQENATAAVRCRTAGDLGAMSVGEFTALCDNKILNKINN